MQVQRIDKVKFDVFVNRSFVGRRFLCDNRRYGTFMLDGMNNSAALHRGRTLYICLKIGHSAYAILEQMELYKQNRF